MRHSSVLCSVQAHMGKVEDRISGLNVVRPRARHSSDQWGAGTIVAQPGCCSFSTSEHGQLPLRVEKRTVSRKAAPHTSS